MGILVGGRGQRKLTVYVPSTRVQGSPVCLAPCRGQQLHTVPPLLTTVPRGHTSMTALSSGETKAQRAAWDPIRGGCGR